MDSRAQDIQRPWPRIVANCRFYHTEGPTYWKYYANTGLSCSQGDGWAVLTNVHAGANTNETRPGETFGFNDSKKMWIVKLKTMTAVPKATWMKEQDQSKRLTMIGVWFQNFRYKKPQIEALMPSSSESRTESYHVSIKTESHTATCQCSPRAQSIWQDNCSHVLAAKQEWCLWTFLNNKSKCHE